MPDQVEFEFTFERGVNLFDRPSVIGEGAVQQLDNFEWLPNGGVVPRPAWKAAGASPTGAPASGNRAGRGLFLRWYEAGVRKLVLALKDSGNAYSFYKTNVADPTAFSTYTAINTALAIPAANVNDIVRFAVGNSKLVYTSPGFPTGRLRRYDGTTADEIAVDNIAGRTIAYHLNRFWTGGGLTNPTYLRFSEIGNEAVWTVEENFIPVGQDDLEPIEDVVIFDRGLLIAKQHSLWFLSGTDPTKARLDPITDALGGARGKCLIPSEFGVFIIGLAGEVYLYDGAEVRPVTRNMEVELPTTGYVTGAWTHGKLYVRTSNNERIWAYEPPPADRWRREITQDAANGPWD
ncbi:MAG TPA: hypothetical protein VFQ40_06150, partial [Actinomycetota bacterium]|nr:hypothetical protein [Actinomycetota bacterium]